MTMDIPLAIVTGAGRGIGKAVAFALSRAAYRVALIARSKDELEKTAALCRDNHPAEVEDSAVVYSLDVSDTAAVSAC